MRGHSSVPAMVFCFIHSLVKSTFPLLRGKVSSGTLPWPAAGARGEGSCRGCIPNRRRPGKQTGSSKTTVCEPFRGWNFHPSQSQNPCAKCRRISSRIGITTAAISASFFFTAHGGDACRGHVSLRAPSIQWESDKRTPLLTLLMRLTSK